MERYGDYFSGSDFELDEALLEASTQQPHSKLPARSRARKSAGPAVLAAIDLPGAAQPPKAGGELQPSQPASLTRHRRRTLAPGQVSSMGMCLQCIGDCDMTQVIRKARTPRKDPSGH